MLVRICPLCDSEMKKAHYCDTCHSFIWKPQMLDIHYNTETRGLGEEDCAYGEEHDAVHHRGKSGKSAAGSRDSDHDRQENISRNAVYRKEARQEYNSGNDRQNSDIKRANSASAGSDHDQVFGPDVRKKSKKSSPASGCLLWFVIILVIIAFINGFEGC